MASKQHPARSTFKHYGRAITVEMVDPKVGLDGRVNVDPSRYTYQIPLNKRGAVVNLVGLITRATFEVTGWQHPIRFTTTNIGIGDPVIIQHIAIGKLGDLWAMEYKDVDLNGLAKSVSTLGVRRHLRAHSKPAPQINPTILNPGIHI